MKEYWRGKCRADRINTPLRANRVRCAIFHRHRATKEASRTIYNAQVTSILLNNIPIMMKVVLLDIRHLTRQAIYM
jgi:hypothetical protein